MTKDNQENINAIAEALYNLKPEIVQEEDPVDGSPRSATFTVPWSDIRDNYPATFEAIWDIAETAAYYVTNVASLPLNTYAGVHSNLLQEGYEVVRFDLVAERGQIDEIYGDEEDRRATVIWDKTGCSTDDIPLSSLVLATEG